MASRPTKKMILAGAQAAWRRSQAQREADEFAYDTFWNNHELIFPETIADSERVMRYTGATHDQHARIVNLLLSRAPTLNVRYDRADAQSNRLAEEVETWNLQVDKVMRRNFDPWLAAIQDQVLYGRGIYGVYFLPGVWNDFPRQDDFDVPEDYYAAVDEFTANASLPFIERHIPAPEFVPVLGDNGQLVGGYWFGRKRAADVAEKYPQTGLRRRLRDGEISSLDLVEWVEYADSHYMAYILGEVMLAEQEGGLWLSQGEQLGDVDVVKLFEHGTPGMVPYVYVSGEQGPSSEHHRKHLSALWFAMQNIRDLDNVLSQRATTVYSMAQFPPLLFYVDSAGMPVTGDSRKEMETEIKLRLHSVIVAFKDRGEEAHYLEHPGVPTSVDSDIALLQEMIARNTLGSLESATGESGAATALRFQIAATKYQFMADRIASAYEQICLRRLAIARRLSDEADRNIKLYVDDLRPTVANGTRKLLSRIAIGGRSHLSRRFTIVASIPQAVQPDLAMRVQATTALRQGEYPFMSDRMIREILWDIPHNQEIEDELLLQQYERSPEKRAVLMQEVARRTGALLDADDLRNALALPGAAPGEIPPAFLQALQQAQAPGQVSPQPSFPFPGGTPAGQLQPQAGPATNIGLGV